MRLSFSRPNLVRPWPKLALVCVACLGLAFGSSATLRHEVTVLTTGARAALINAGLVRSGQLSLVHLRPAYDVAPQQGWAPARPTVLPDLGQVLGPYTSQDGLITFDSTLPEQARAAVLTFDLVLFGSWDASNQPYGGVEGDGIVFGVNGVPFHRALFQNWGRDQGYRAARVTIGETDYALTLVRRSAWQDYRGTGAAFDSRWTLRLEATGHPAPLRLTLRSTANDLADEHFALAHLTVQHD